MIISHKHKFIFYKPLKVGGSSIEVNLLKHCGPEDILTGSDIVEEQQRHGYTHRNVFNSDGITHFHMHTGPELLKLITQNDWSDYFKFSAVRNPWDLCVSYFWWCFYSPHSANSISRLSRTAPQEDDDISTLRRKFAQFLTCSADFTSGPRGPEGKQVIVDWLARTNQEFHQDMDYVIRYENLQEDYENACVTLNLPHEKLPHLKSLQRKSPAHYSAYYDESTYDKVRHAFCTSIQEFEYKFDAREMCHNLVSPQRVEHQ